MVQKQKGSVQTKKQGKKGKGGKKKVADPFLKKEWYVVKIPKTQFADFGSARMKFRAGYTPANKSKSKKALDRRTFIVNLGDLQSDPYAQNEKASILQWKKFKFVAEERWGQQLLTQFCGMEITRDRRCSLVFKWHTMIQAICDAKTTDGYILRVSALAFTKRQPTQVKRNCYAKKSQVRMIRARMCEIIKNTISSSTLTEVIFRLSKTEVTIHDSIGYDIEKTCQLIFPLKCCCIEKVKVLRKPKRDVSKLMEIHDLSAPAYDPIEETMENNENNDADYDDGGDGHDDEDSVSTSDSLDNLAE